MIQAWETTGAINFAGAIDGAGIETFGLVDGVLDLQARFNVFEWGGDEGNGPAGHYAGDSVADGGELRCGLLGREFELSDVGWGEGEDGAVGEDVFV